MSTQKNPFVGLRPFESDESLLFFGRQQQTVELLEQLHKHHFVAIVGSSGSGKSSLIRAGLIPSLKAGYLIQDRDSWMMAVMKPGQTPLYNLAEAILTEIDTGPDEAAIQALVQKIKEQGADAVIAVLEPLWTVRNKNVFILVDQFEELFRFSGEINAAERKNNAIDFVNILLSLASQPELPVYIVITLRSDFIGECSQFYGLPEAMNESQYLVPRLNRTQLKNVITGPIAIAGATISNSLLNHLLNDVGDNQDQLPILQHALMRTFDVWKEQDTGQPIDNAEYRQIGTMKHALSQHAEEAFSELKNNKEKLVCEKMFKALTDKRIGTKGVRRPQTFSDLLLITDANAAELSNVINVFRKSGRAFIMPPEKVYLTPATVIDISHESLMRVWDRLQTWVDAESESKQIYLRLSDAAALYAQGKGGLWRNPELQIALLWKKKDAPNATWAAQVNSNFDQAMQFLEQSRLQEEQERKEKELEQKKRLLRARKTAAAFVILFLAALGVMAYAFTLKGEATLQQKEAVRQKNEAIKQKSVALEQQENAIKSAQIADSLKSVALSSKDSALYQKHVADSLAAVAFDASGRATKSSQEALRQKDTALIQKQMADNAKLLAEQATKTAKEKEEIAKYSQAKTETLKNLADSRNLSIKAIAQMNEKRADSSKSNALQAYEENLNNNGSVQDNNIYKALYVNWGAVINGSNQFNGHKYPVHCITGTKNYIFTADESGKILVSSIQGTALVAQQAVDTKSDIRALAVSPDGSRLAAFAVRGDGFLFTISPDGSLKKLAAPYFSFTGICKSAAFYNNSQLLLLSNAGVTKFNINEADKDVYTSNDLAAMYVSNSGHIYLATAKNVSVYNDWSELKTHSGKPVLQLKYNAAGDVCSLAVDAKEQYVAVGTYNGNVTVANILQNTVQQTTKLHQSGVNDLKFAYVAGNRLQVASAGADKTIRLIDVESFLRNKNNEEIIVLEGHNKWVYQLFYSSNGKLLFSSGEDNKVMIWKPTMTDLYETLQQKQ